MAQLDRTLTGSSQKSEEGLAPPIDLSTITTTNTQTGVLNHLSEHQHLLLLEFKERLQQDGWWSPDGVNGKPTHDDGTLLRYLRARKFDVQGAIGQFTETERWMKEQHVEDLYEHFDVDFFERARLMYPQWTGHRDRRGIPLYVYEIKGLDTKAVDKYQKESAAYKAKLPKHKDLLTPSKLLPLFALYHNLLNFILPLCSSLERPRPEIPVTNATNIVDISGVSLKQFWNLKGHMQDASVLATARYPETLDRIFIIGAPSFFPTVWGWIKRWFDPVTVSKIFILGRGEVTPTLERFMNSESIPKKYGGTLDWQWGDVPNIDADTRKALERDGNKGWVKGPALWLNNERIVVGSENGILRRSEKEIAEKKPIVYAADYTEEPVHPEKRRSSTLSTHKRSTEMKHLMNGTLLQGQSESPTTVVKDKQLSVARATTAVAVNAPMTGANTVQKERPVTPQRQIPAHLPAESVRNSPMGDAHVHLPSAQAAAPATTAEYISPAPSAQQVAPSQSIETPTSATILRKETPNSRAVAAGPTPAATVSTSTMPSHTTTSAQIVPTPPGHAQPGPLSAHQAEMNRIMASKLEGESTITIPADATGNLPHQDIIVTSDPSKGLAMEAEKLALGGATYKERPRPERFVTAFEVPH